MIETVPTASEAVGESRSKPEIEELLPLESHAANPGPAIDQRIQRAIEELSAQNPTKLVQHILDL